MSESAVQPIAIAPEDQAPAESFRPEDAGVVQTFALSDEAANDGEFAGVAADPRLEQVELFKAQSWPDIFNDVAAPPGVEFTQAQLAMASQMNNAYGDMTIGVQGGGSFLTEETDFYDNLPDEDDEVDEHGRKRPKVSGSMKDAIEQVSREQAERARAWDERMHIIGGKEYSGEELMAMRDYLQDEKHQQDFEHDLVANEGLTKEEAKQRRQKLQETLDLLEKERRGKLTPEEQLKLDKLNANPTTGQDLANYKSRLIAQGSLSLQGENKADVVKLRGTSTQAAQQFAKDAAQDIPNTRTDKLEQTLALLDKERQQGLSALERTSLISLKSDSSVGASLKAIERAEIKGLSVAQNNADAIAKDPSALTNKFSSAATLKTDVANVPASQQQVQAPLVQVARVSSANLDL